MTRVLATTTDETQAVREAALERFHRLPARHQEMARARWDVLTACREYMAGSGVPGRQGREQFAAEYTAGRIDIPAHVRRLIPRVDPTTLYRWEGRERQGGLPALASTYGTRAGRTQAATNPELGEWIAGLMHARPDVRAGQAWEILQSTHPDLAATTSLRSLTRYLAQWRSDNQQLHKFLSNPDAWKSHMKWSPGNASAGIVRVNQVWELDSTPADVLLLDGRHSIIGCIDVFTRRAKLVVSRTSTASAVGACFRRALLDWGVPEVARTDNGHDYTSRQFTAVLTALQVEHDICPPFKSEAKPYIERFFGTFTRSLLELLPGFAGHNVADRKRIEARVPFKERLFKEREPIEIRLSAEDLQRFCDRWIEEFYELRPHHGLGGRTPRQVAAEWMAQHPVRRIQKPRALDVLLADAPQGGFRSVSKKGIALEGATYTAPELALHVGRRVAVKWADGDYGRVWVFTESGEFICEAVAAHRAGVSLAEIAAVGQDLQKRALRVARDAGRAAQQAFLDGIDVIDETFRRHRESTESTESLPAAVAAEEFTTPALDEASLAAADPAPPPPPPHDSEALERGASAIARIEARRARRAGDDDTALNDQLWERYQALRGRNDLTDAERSWLRSFETTPIYRSRKRLEPLAVNAG